MPSSDVHHEHPGETDAALASQLFGHEQELVGNLRRFPMVVRYRLDILHLRMPLELWQQLDYETRRTLCVASWSSETDQALLAALLQEKIKAIQGKELEPQEPEDLADYRNLEEVPESIKTALARFGLSIEVAQWAAISELGRFGLAKLSRHGHHNKRLGPLIDDVLYRDRGTRLEPRHTAS